MCHCRPQQGGGGQAGQVRRRLVRLAPGWRYPSVKELESGLNGAPSKRDPRQGRAYPSGRRLRQEGSP